VVRRPIESGQLRDLAANTSDDDWSKPPGTHPAPSTIGKSVRGIWDFACPAAGVGGDEGMLRPS
jgi:hypothetical protein